MVGRSPNLFGSDIEVTERLLGHPLRFPLGFVQWSMSIV